MHPNSESPENFTDLVSSTDLCEDWVIQLDYPGEAVRRDDLEYDEVQ